MALSRSVAMACAVSAMMGILRSSGVALIRRVASQPSIAGRLMSIKMRSGLLLVAIATPRELVHGEADHRAPDRARAAEIRRLGERPQRQSCQSQLAFHNPRRPGPLI